MLSCIHAIAARPALQMHIPLFRHLPAVLWRGDNPGNRRFMASCAANLQCFLDMSRDQRAGSYDITAISGNDEPGGSRFMASSWAASSSALHAF